ncbi:hypothetical protein FDP41_012880 [Naegleria fowleri]|uniref:Uncharacterized protein n=1 Tax=Naegleria fowleri TaxID=5763 RepID=A0A6A5C2W4_NAEFO|nr:uncharacterized protein FDP41_012880 [Naegleria fowleri]KAF0981092.1 hypothetical protein FDP41_012880 [Naegleria fowleri]CAG4711717.1 unnamed protein product [Naegleria fowleri]
MSLNKKSVTYPVGNRSATVLGVNRKYYGKHEDDNNNNSKRSAKGRSVDAENFRSLYTTNPNLRKSDLSAEKINKLTLRTRREKRVQSAEPSTDLEYRKHASEKFSHFLHTRPSFSFAYHSDLNPYAKQHETIFHTNIGTTWTLHEKMNQDLETTRVANRNECLSEKRLENAFYIKPIEKSKDPQGDSGPQRLVKVDKFTTSPDKTDEMRKLQQLRDSLVRQHYIPYNEGLKTTNTEMKINESLKQYFPFEPKLRYGRSVTYDTTSDVVPDENTPQYATNNYRLVRKLNDHLTFQKDVYSDLRNKTLTIAKNNVERKRKVFQSVEDRARESDKIEANKDNARILARRSLKDQYIQTIHENDAAHLYDFCTGERLEHVKLHKIGYPTDYD